MKTSEIPSWFWETDQEPRDEILHIGPELEEQRWVSNGHVMLRVDPVEKGDAPVVPPRRAGMQAPLKYAHLMLVASMTEIVSEASGTAPRLPHRAYMMPDGSGDSPDDFACRIGERSFRVRYMAWIERCYPSGIEWSQNNDSPAYAAIEAGIRKGTIVAVVQSLVPPELQVKKT